MLSVGSFVKPCHSSYALEPLSSKLIISFHLLIPSKTHNTKPPHSLYPNARSGCLFLQKRAELFAISATKSSRENNESLLEMHGGDEEDDYEDDDADDDADAGADADADEAFVPFPDMTRWFEKKPPGFGEGKKYDTSVEDKLFEEMQQSRRAQLANINKLKYSSLKTVSKNEKQMKNATEVVSGAIRVRVWNLPKKWNIHKDLQLAFKGFPGILNISPAVSANKKTRDVRALLLLILHMKRTPIVTWEEIEENISQFELSESNENVVITPRTVLKTDSSSLKQPNNSRKDKKNTIIKGKAGKVPKKLVVPGSAKRLYMKEKAVLTGVLAKYGAKTSAAS